MILLLQRTPSDALATLKSAFPDEEVEAISIGERRAADAESPDAVVEPPDPRSGVSAEGAAEEMRRRMDKLQTSSVLGPMARVIAQTVAEATAMRATPIGEASQQTNLERVLRRLDTNGATAIVCADPTAQRLGWKVAHQRPDLLVIAGVSAATAILPLIDNAGLSRTPTSVAAVLGTRAPMGTYPFPDMRRPGRPRVVSLVSNKVDGDSRVQKVASTLADLGYESILVGRHPDGGRDHYMLRRALVVRLPVPLSSNDAERDSPPRTPLTAFAYKSRAQASAARRRAQARARRLSAEPLEELGSVAIRKDAIKQWAAAVRIALHTKNRRRFFSLRGDESIETAGAWRRPLVGNFDHWALADDLELGYGPYVESLRPDVIHAHDADMLSVAMVAAARLQATGHDVRVVYDAHEHTAGTARPHARHSAVLAAVERRYVPRCDAVITVSDEIAALLQAEHGLARTPAVVTNAPTLMAGERVVGVRQRLGLPESVPLLVYVGGVAPQRGVDLAVSALPFVPDAHLALVAPANRRTEALASLARDLGVSDRVHRLDYVAADEVVAFIRSCDVGLIPFRPLPNSELGLPTKYREYLVAGLPIVASDQGLVAEEVRRTRVGTLFRSGDTDDLARAITDLLASHGAYRARITKELTAGLIWEGQTEVLREVYSSLASPSADLAPTRDGSSSPAVLTGRTNMAGQGIAWARALRRAGVEATSLQVVLPDNDFDFEADITVREDDWDRPGYRLRAFVDLVPRHTHALIEYGIPLFDNTIKPLGDLDSLVRSGLSVGLIFHGSDVRRPLRHAEREPWSPFLDPDNAVLTQALNERTARLHQALATYEGPCFVSTPDLLDDVPFAHWLPVVVDVDAYTPNGRGSDDTACPVVVHLPSRDPMRGTRHVEPVLRRLDAEGLLRYRQFANLPQALVPTAIATADIVIDQIDMNVIGVGAAHALAAGRVCVAHMDDRLAERFPRRPPVVDANPETIEQVVRALVADTARRAELCELGRKFALDVHDGRLSAQVLERGLDLQPRATRREPQPGVRTRRPQPQLQGPL